MGHERQSAHMRRPEGDRDDVVRHLEHNSVFSLIHTFHTFIFRPLLSIQAPGHWQSLGKWRGGWQKNITRISRVTQRVSYLLERVVFTHSFIHLFCQYLSDIIL